MLGAECYADVSSEMADGVSVLTLAGTTNTAFLRAKLRSLFTRLCRK